METKTLMDALNQTKNFSSLLFNPHAPEWNVLVNGWPKITEMIKANKRLLIVDEEKRSIHATRLNGLIRTRDYLIQNHFKWLTDITNSSNSSINIARTINNNLEEYFFENITTKNHSNHHKVS